MNLEATLAQLAARRPVFHSESDLQHELAWVLREITGADLRLEVPMPGFTGRASLDILLSHAGMRVGIELKYPKRALNRVVNSEMFKLSSSIARDIIRHDICKDIMRLERAIEQKFIEKGYLIVVTNDSSFWTPGQREDVIDADFHVHGGRILEGTLTWSERAGAGTTAKRDTPLVFAGSYSLEWGPYSRIEGERFGEFRSLIVEVNTPASPEVIPVASRSSSPSIRETRPPSLKREGLNRLQEFFRECQESELTMTFAELESIRGPLPASARNHSAWWSHVASHPQAVWEHEGYRASPKLADQRVVFRKR